MTCFLEITVCAGCLESRCHCDVYDAMTKLPRGKIVGPEPKNEAEHFRQCEKCGTLYDMRDLDAVFAHDGPLPHPEDAKQ
jgi:methionyl-tRNA synthetase